MVYKYVYSPDNTLAGYIDHSLSCKYYMYNYNSGYHYDYNENYDYSYGYLQLQLFGICFPLCTFFYRMYEFNTDYKIKSNIIIFLKLKKKN